jgi:hypothetical protein
VYHLSGVGSLNHSLTSETHPLSQRLRPRSHSRQLWRSGPLTRGRALHLRDRFAFSRCNEAMLSLSPISTSFIIDDLIRVSTAAPHKVRCRRRVCEERSTCS